MSWELFLFLLRVDAIDFCKPYKDIEIKKCVTYVEECVLDGEEFHWCADDWHEWGRFEGLCHECPREGDGYFYQNYRRPSVISGVNNERVSSKN